MIMHSGTNKWDNLGFIMNWPSIGRLKKKWQRRSIINDGCFCEHGNNLGGCGHPTLLKILKDGFLNEYAYDHMGGSWNRGTPSHYPFLDGIFPHKPSIRGYPIYGNHMNSHENMGLWQTPDCWMVHLRILLILDDSWWAIMAIHFLKQNQGPIAGNPQVIRISE